MSSMRCAFPGGCANKVRTENGPMCHHHRRFIGNTGRMSVTPRLPNVIDVARRDEQTFERALESANKIMETRPRLYWDSGSMQFYMNGWRKGGSIHGLDGQSVKPPCLVGNVIVLEQIGSDPNNSWLTFKPRDGVETLTLEDKNIMNNIVAGYNQDDYMDRSGVLGISEVYDDPGEIIAQLELGSEKGYRVNFSSIAGREDQVVQVIQNRPERDRVFTITLSPTTTGMTREGLTGKSFTVSSAKSEPGDAITDEDLDLIEQVVALRNLVENDGFKTRDGKIAMPIGWTDREAPVYPLDAS